MSVRFDQATGDIVIEGFDKGISSSPNTGIAALRNANIVTEQSEAMSNFSRTMQTLTPFTGGGVARSGGGATVVLTGSTHLFVVGEAIVLTNSTMSSLSNGNYYIQAQVSGTAGLQTVAVTATFGGAAITGIGVGTGNFATFNINQPVASAIENYFDGTNPQVRYYITDVDGFVWVQDTGISWSSATWTCIDINDNHVNISGLAVLNGWLLLFQPSEIWVKETVLLGVTWAGISAFKFNSPLIPYFPHFCLVSHSGTLNYTDGNYISTISPNSSSGPGVANVFSYGTYTFSTYTLTVNIQIDGDFPIIGQQMTFTVSPGGTLPTGITANTVYYVTDGTNSVYFPNQGEFSISATVGGAAISLSGGSGTQYFNSFSPSASTTYVFDAQACTINDGTPVEVATSLAELGNTIIIGTRGNTLYQWDEISPTWVNFVPMAETNCAFLLTVNNNVFAFMGQKGNIYVTTGSSASGVLTIPDYLAGIPGTPSSYVEPYFVWGQAFFQRGRVFFSIQDQTSSKAGNCGGIYSFVPSFYNSVTGQDAGTALRLENFNSYETYNGLANVLLSNQNQNANGIQYFSAWTSNINSPTYGIDTSSTTPYTSGEVKIETDIVTIGTYIDKGNYTAIQSRYTAPLQSGESVTVEYRVNATDAWSSFTDTTAGVDSTTGSIGARWPVPWANALQVQFRISLKAIASNSSFVRFRELRLTKTGG